MLKSILSLFSHRNHTSTSRMGLPALLLGLILILSACSSTTTTSSTDSSNGSTPSSETNATTTSESPVQLTISAAASLTDSLQEIQTLYQQQHPNVNLTFNFAASGTLQKQIEQGAPADLFFSAGSKQMDALLSANLIDKTHEKDLLANDLVLIVPKDSALTLSSLQDLTRDNIKKLAVGTPESVPAGMYAKQTLESSGIWDKLQSKIVLTKDVKQVLSYVETGNAEAGFVYKTDAMDSDKVQVALTTTADSHDPILYPAGIVSDTTHPEEAAAFYDYLQTDEAQAIFVKHGFMKASASS